MYMEVWWDTTLLCKTFNIDGACSILVDNSPIHHGFVGTYWGGGMHGLRHSEETKERMRQSALGRDMSKAIAESIKVTKGKPAHNRGAVYKEFRKEGSLIKDGKVYFVKGIAEFCKKYNLNASHIGSVLSGKRKSHKGFRKHG